ncbi:MAG: transglycosylase SLT domain-containing protein [Synechococcus sp.]
MQAGSRHGALLLLGTTGASLLVIGLGRVLLPQRHIQLSPETPPTELWRTYRWSFHPERRRDAALLMSGHAADDPHRRQHLLKGQGWGSDPLAAVALGLAAETSQRLNQQSQAQQTWEALLQRFPHSASAARGMEQKAVDDPSMGLRLLKQDPAHPAALAVAAALDPAIGPHRGALHLAQWGASWPGASARIRAACADNSPTSPSQPARQQLAKALADLGAGEDALSCLHDATPQGKTALSIGRALLFATPEQQRQGEALLVALAQAQPSSDEARDAARLLSDPLLPDPALLKALPEELSAQSAAVAAGHVRLANGEGADTVLTRWPDDPASWQLQWDVARDALLNQRWSDAQAILEQLPAPTLPGPLEGRRRFWLGFSHQRQGNRTQAEREWTWLIRHQPPGYYRWRAHVRLQREPSNPVSPTTPQGWQPLADSDALVNQLWRLGLIPEAWSTWRSRHYRADRPLSPQQQLVEGRLRIAMGDTWTGLDQLWRLSLRWRTPSCRERTQLHQSQFPRPFHSTFQQAAQEERVPQDLLLAIAKQESRFAPGVASIAGAQGLMQLMPATAQELAGRPLSLDELRELDLNSRLAARYLHQLLTRWHQDPVLAIASYNAGPGNAARWHSEEATEHPELWIERIPFAETRYYVKKVLANWNGYREPLDSAQCEQEGTGQTMTEPEAKQHPAA